MKRSIEIVLLPIAMIGFATIITFFLIRDLIAAILISSPINHLGLAIGNQLPTEIAHKIVIFYLKIIGFLWGDHDP